MSVGRRKIFCRLCAVLLMLAAIAAASSSGAQLTPQEQRGQQIYRQGISLSGQEITALLNQNEVPASTLPCASCHGADGRGRPEGGVTPSNITWAALTKPYDIVHPNGRRHPPYTERHLKRAITMSIDPAGNQLHTAMPRYRMSHQDLEDLLAYLKRLGQGIEPGVTDAAIRIGVILPPRARLSEMNRAISGVLAAYGEEVNRRGGIYARRIELRFIEAHDTQAATVKAVRTWLDQESIFALISSFNSGADEALASLAEERELPLLGAFSVPSSQHSSRFAFYIYSGLNEQARALAIFAARQWSQHVKAVIIHADDEQTRAAAATIKVQCQKLGWPLLEQIVITDEKLDGSSLARRLREQAVKVIFFLGGSAAQNQLLAVAQQLDWQPALLVPSALAGREIFAAPLSFDRRIFLAYPTLPTDLLPAALAEYQHLIAAHQFTSSSRPAQLTALAAARLLTEALKRTGQEVSREKLISTLENFYQFKTGLTPALTFGPNRRTGAAGAYIVALDLNQKTLLPSGGWIELD